MPYADKGKMREYQTQYRKESRKFAKEHGFCIVCFSRKASPGHSTCLECRMARRERDYKRRESSRAALKNSEQKELDKRAARKKHVAERRQNLIEQGICTQCGKRKTDGYQICDVCRKRINNRRRKKYSDGKETPIILYGQEGFCSRCGEPTYGNSKLCKFHYDIAVKNLSHVGIRGTKEYRDTNKLFFMRKGVMVNESAPEPAKRDEKGD